MEIQEKKSELINRLAKVQNANVLDEIEKILNQEENQEFDFEKAIAEGYTVEEFRTILEEKIRNWQWKNKPSDFSFEYNLEEEAKNGLTTEEFKQEMFNRIRKFPWKK